MKRQSLIGLDYDGTITADPECFKAIIRCFQSCGHRVYCVTMRHEELDWDKDFEELRDKYDVETIFCDGYAKRSVCQDRGLNIDIFIDDWPEGIAIDSIYTPIQLTEWRKEQKKLNAA